MPTEEHKLQYQYIYTKTIEKSLQLFDTDKPKVGRPLIEFLTFWLQEFKKADTLE
jgi:hypothetical protein